MIPKGWNGLLVRDAQAACGFNCLASKCAPFFHRISTTVVDRRETELLPAFDSGMSWRGIDDVFASGTNAAGAQCRATRAIAMR